MVVWARLSSFSIFNFQFSINCMSHFKLIVGLGNPGQQYEGTRHNLGFAILDEWILQEGLSFVTQRKQQALVAKSGALILAKPQTFMNLSGRSVQSLVRFYQVPLSQILVVYDDKDLELGKLRFKQKGSAGGHNGMKSIMQSLGSQEINRLKLGIGGVDKFSSQEQEVLPAFFDEAKQAIRCACEQGVLEASSKFHQ